MRKNILYFVTITAFMLFGACSNDLPIEEKELPIETATTLTFTASMPDEGPATRVELSEAGTSNIAVNWKAGDVIKFAVQQGENNAILAGEYELKNTDIATPYSSKRARFEVDIPTEVVSNQPFTIYGVHNGGGIAVSGQDVNAVLPRRPYMEVEDNTIGTKQNDVMLYFKKEIASGSDINNVTFNHLGSIIAIHVTSNRDRNFKGFQLTGVDASGNTFVVSNNTHWAYNSFYPALPADENYLANTFNIETGVFSNNGPGWDTTSDNYLHIRKKDTRFNIEAGTPKIFYAWYPILENDLTLTGGSPSKEYTVSATWPRLRIDVRDIYFYTPYNIDGTNWTAGPKTPERGKTYHFYAEWTAPLATNGTIKWVSPTVN